MRNLSLSVVALLAAGLTARALMVAPAPIPNRVAFSDVVVVGKVVSFEEKKVKAERFPGDQDKNSEFRIAVIKVEDPILGARGLTHIKVGTWVPPPPPPDTPDTPTRPVRPIRPIRPNLNVELKEGQELCLFLKQHHKESFHVAPNYFDVIARANNPNFANDVAEAKKAAARLNDPAAGLTAKTADERFQTAALLVLRYRTQTGGPGRWEPIDAKESRQILEALKGADWTTQPTRPFQMTPQTILGYLQLTPKDGWQPPRDFRQFGPAAKQWLEANAATYRIQRWVPGAAPK
jgi:hypothetical protein